MDAVPHDHATMTAGKAVLDLEPLLDERLDWRFRMIPEHPGALTVRGVGVQGWRLLGDDLLFPAMVIRESALTHNLSAMAAYCRDHDVELAPHGKTAMAPQLLARQLAAGAWGVTVANVSQARVFRRFGAPRILIANEVVDPAGIAWLARELDRDPAFTAVCQVDSLLGVAILEAAMEEAGGTRQLPVLMELGVEGGRTGCRTEAEALAVAQSVGDADHLILTGVEGYEGVLGHDREGDTVAAVNGFLRRVRALAERLAATGAFDDAGEMILTAGGSAYFDNVADCLASGWEGSRLPVSVIVRSGCYATHDCDYYEHVSPLGGVLRPALEVWGRVLSRPEPSLAICGFGRRDTSFDIALPTPQWVSRGGAAKEPADGALEVIQLNDQHAFIKMDAGFDLQPGDLIGCGITHPCTAFDKWPLVLEVDDDDRVSGAMRTYF